MNRQDAVDDAAVRMQRSVRVTWKGFFINAILSIAKILAGFFGHSAAMIADGIHSVSDFVTDIIVLVFVKISAKGSDGSHRYGHGKFETFATFLVSFALLAVGFMILFKGITSIISILRGDLPQTPTSLALIAAFVSIVVKELLFRYTRHVGRSINSQAVIANAWHHRSDAFSSIGTLIGIGGAILLGGKFIILDPIASTVVSVFILRVAFQIGMPSINELLERSLPVETEKQIVGIIMETEDVKSYHKLKTRKIGNNIAVDVHVQLPKEISFIASHEVATSIERRLRSQFGAQTQINIHTEPV